MIFPKEASLFRASGTNGLTDFWLEFYEFFFYNDYDFIISFLYDF